MERLRDRVAVVTGAGSGIGEASARRLAAEGARVVVADVDAQRAETVAKTIAEDGGAATPVTVDVSTRAGVEAAIGAAVDGYGGLDVLHNNAGIGSMVPMSMVDDDTIDRLIGVNLRGVYYGIAAAGPIMTAAGGGAIVNTASVAGLFGAPLQVLYSATKGAVIGMTRAAAMELAPTVRVNAVCPGGVSTRFVETIVGDPAVNELMDQLGQRVHPIGRNADPAEIAAAVAFLASDDASFMTGACLVADGGMTAGALVELVDGKIRCR